MKPIVSKKKGMKRMLNTLSCNPSCHTIRTCTQQATTRELEQEVMQEQS
jgi:hypothetical protein